MLSRRCGALTHDGAMPVVFRHRNFRLSSRSVRFDDNSLWVNLTDGRVIAVPLAWFPRLLNATPQQREQVELSRYGLHWEALDEDISVAGLLAGQGDMTRQHPRAA
jgi:hypothetical protein